MKYIKKYINTIIQIIITIVFSIIIFNMNECFMNKDDEVYREVFYNFATFKTWAWEFYHIWSGRIITSALSNIFLRMPLVIFKIFNTIVYDIAIIAIYKIILKIFKISKNVWKDMLLIALFLFSFMIDKGVRDSSIFWVTGSFNYLWPTAFMLVAIIPFIKMFLDNENTKKTSYIIYFLSIFIACFAEQSALILLSFGAIAIGYKKFIKKEKIDKIISVYYIIIIILSMIELLAPGNRVRFLASTLRRYPTFYMLGIGDKLLQGVIVIANQLLSEDIMLIIALTLLIMVNSITNKEKSILFKIFSTIPFLYFVLSIILSKLGILDGILYNIPNFGITYIYGLTVYIPVILFVIIMCMILDILIFSYKDIVKGILIGIIFCAGIASALSISISPTIFASGTRIFLTMDILLIIIMGSLMINIINNILDKKKMSIKFLT